MSNVTNQPLVEVSNLNTPTQVIFAKAIEFVMAENQRVLQTMNYPAVEQLAQKITVCCSRSHSGSRRL